MTGRLWTLLHALLWMAAAAVAAEPCTLATGVAGAALGALLGVLGGKALASSRLRTWALPLLALAAGATALEVGNLLTRWAGPSRLLGPRNLYALAEMLPAVFLPLGLVAALEALARRHAVWRLLGLAVLVALFAALFAAHREGFLNRPYFLVDPLWGHGLDPLPWFLFLGLVLAALLAVVLVGADAGRRAVAGLAVLIMALVAAFLLLPQRHLKEITELHRVQGQGDPGAGETQEERQGGGKEGKPGTKQPNQDPADTFQNQSSDAFDGPVAVVVFHNDYTPPMGAYYFRETAFSAYNGLRVVQDQGQHFDRDLPELGARPLSGPQGAEVRTTVAVMATHSRPFGLVGPVTFREVGNPDPKRFFQAYDVVSRACVTPPRDLLQAPLGDAAWDGATWAHYTQGPGDPRYGDLARTILGDLEPRYRTLPFAKALAIKLWLDRNTIYSTSTTHGDSLDPVADFLFGDRRGHCVYLAHAACLLYRAAGLPARVGAGYSADPDFRFGGASLLLRAANAHAWPEVYVRGQGWMPLDISPARSEAPPQEAPDKDLQRMLGEMALSDQPPPPPPPAMGQPPLEERLAFLGRILGLALLVLAALVLPAALAVKGWRQGVPFFCRPDRVPRLAYRAALDTAAGHGFLRHFGETREAFAVRVGSEAFTRLTALHLRWALGPRDGDPPVTLCRELLRLARRQVKGASTRRWRASLDPRAWTRVH